MGNIKQDKFSLSKTEVSSWKEYFLIIFIVTAMLIIAGRLYILQISKNNYYTALATNNHVSRIKRDCPRGTIFDRNGIKLAEDISSYNLFLIPSDIKNINTFSSVLSRIINIKVDTINKIISDNKLSEMPLLVKNKLNDKEIAELNELSFELKGIFIKEGFTRIYPNNKYFSHAVGYAGIINSEELKEYPNIDPDERVGKSGIEKYYEKLLHGSKGIVMQVVDARGKILKEVEEKPVEKGKNIYLTIDINLQKKVEDIIKDHRGSAIIINPKNGEILAMASNPSFDPNIFSKLIPDIEWNALNNQRAFFNIPIQGSYPPGSTFKALISLFGLENKIINSQSKYVCTGDLKVKGLEEKYKCWVYPSSHGAINLKEALKQSCDIFFYLLAKNFDINLFERFAVKYGGLTEKTGIDLPYEESGFLGSPDWKKKYVGYPWYDGDSMNLGIGQGYLSVTPVQMIKMYSRIANDGVNITPHLLLKTNDGKGFYDLYPLSNKDSISIKEENIKLVRQDLTSVTEPGGTAYGLNFDNIKVAAKTGTAEGSTGVHLWLISIVPADNPEIVSLVLFENSTKQFASELVPYSKQILQYYFKGG